MRTIGLIGGLGWRSTAFYYSAIHCHAAKLHGTDDGVPLILWSLRQADVVPLVRQGGQELGLTTGTVVGAAKGLVAAGAGCVAIACNSAHLLASHVAEAIPVDFIDIRHSVRRAVVAHGYQRVGLLATSFTIQTELYRHLVECGAADEIVIPNSDAQRWLDDLIFDRICKGRVQRSDLREFSNVVERLALKGADVAVLACTDLNLLEVSQLALPILDSAALHAHELALWSLGLAEPGG